MMEEGSIHPDFIIAVPVGFVNVVESKELIAADPEFNLTLEQLQATMEPSKYVGRAPVQVDAFLANVVNPVLEKNQDELGVKAEINV